MSRGDHIASTGLGRLFRGQTAVDFYGKRRIGLIVAIVVIVVTLLSLFTRGLNLGLDFEGGDAWDVPASETFTTDDAADVLEENGVSTTGARIQRRSGETTDVVTIQIEEVSRDVALDLTNGFAERAGVDAEDISFSFTSSTWGGEITEKAVRALVIFLIIVSIFISIRFEYRMAVAALAAMVHDVIVVVGVYSVFGFEVTPATVIAFLTIMGYSLYDTIVVFDKVREVGGRLTVTGRYTYTEMMNLSLNQVLMRSINTSITSVLPVLSMLVIGSFFLGALTLQEFAIALLIGILVGTYSSIFVASSLVAWMKEHEEEHRLVAEKIAARNDATDAGTRRVVDEDVALAGIPAKRSPLATRPARGQAAQRSDRADRTQQSARPGQPPKPRKKKKR